MDAPEPPLAAPPARVERRHHRKSTAQSKDLTLSLSHSLPSPSRPLTALSAPTHRVASPPDIPPRKAPSVGVGGTALSPDAHSPGPLDRGLTPPSSGDPLAPAPASAATEISCPAGAPPLTPFPPWVGSSDSEEGDSEDEDSVWHEESNGGRRSKRSCSVADEQRAVLVLEGRWLFSSVMHGVVLALQSVVALAVFSAVAWVTIWHKSDSDAEFWQWLWIYAEPCVGIILILCCSTLIAHEVRVLSAVALLYLQSAILMVTTVTSLVLWIRCFEEQSRAVKGVLMGCNVFMWGLTFFGFVRGVVLWMVEVEDEADGHRVGMRSPLMRRDTGVWYGTFASEGGGGGGGGRRSEGIRR